MSGVTRVAVLCLALACLAACSSSEESGQYRVEAGDLGAGAQRIRVSRDGKGVTDARVTVNDVLAAHEADGTYVVSEPASMPSGSRVNLLIVAGEDTLQGQAVVPAAPRITAPAANSLFSHTEDVAVEWTAEGSLAGFAVVTTAGRDVRTFEAGGADRRFVIASQQLPSNAGVEVTVIARARGVLAGPVTADSSFSVRSEAANAVVFRRTTPLQVLGGDMGERWQHVRVTAGDDVVEDAVLTLNGQAVPYDGDFGTYSTELSVQAGGELRLEVSRDGALFGVATGLVPEPPTVTAPSNGDSFTATAPLTVTWSSSTNPDRFKVGVSWSCGENCSTGEQFDVAGTARTFDLPGDALPTNTDLRLWVFGYNDGDFVGHFTPDSRMNIRGESLAVQGVRITSN